MNMCQAYDFSLERYTMSFLALRGVAWSEWAERLPCASRGLLVGTMDAKGLKEAVPQQKNTSAMRLKH